MSDVVVTKFGPQGMITLRGNLSDKALQSACKALTGVEVPARGKIATQGDKAIGWMSPDELLLMVPYADANAAVAELTRTLQGQHHLAVNVSDARAMFRLTGAGVRDILAKLTPVDMHPDSMGAGDLRRTHLGQVAAAIWLTEATTAHVVCFRSVADYAFQLMSVASKSDRVGYLT